MCRLPNATLSKAFVECIQRAKPLLSVLRDLPSVFGTGQTHKIQLCVGPVLFFPIRIHASFYVFIGMREET